MAMFLWDNTREGMAIVDVKGRIVKANNAFARFLEYAPVELEGKHIGEIAMSEDTVSDMVEFNALVAGKITSYEMGKRYVTKFGSVVNGKLKVMKFFDTIYIFRQVLPSDDILPMHLTMEERTQVLEEAIGKIVRNNWKKIVLMIIAIIGATAGVVNIEMLLHIFGL